MPQREILPWSESVPRHSVPRILLTYSKGHAVSFAHSGTLARTLSPRCILGLVPRSKAGRPSTSVPHHLIHYNS